MRAISLMCLAWLCAAACGDTKDTGDDDDTATADADPTAPDAPAGAGGPDAAGGGGTPDAAGGGGTPDAAGGGGGTIACGDMTCMAPDICCVTSGGPGPGGTTSECTDEASCKGSVAACDGPEDCDGAEVCCASFDPGGGGGAACTADACQFEVCHTPADCTEPTDMCCTFFGTGVCYSFCGI
jgi:hypothetical protein